MIGACSVHRCSRQKFCRLRPGRLSWRTCAPSMAGYHSYAPSLPSACSAAGSLQLTRGGPARARVALTGQRLCCTTIACWMRLMLRSRVEGYWKRISRRAPRLGPSRSDSRAAATLRCTVFGSWMRLQGVALARRRSLGPDQQARSRTLAQQGKSLLNQPPTQFSALDETPPRIPSH
jgi:hypothetical protein